MTNNAQHFKVITYGLFLDLNLRYDISSISIANTMTVVLYYSAGTRLNPYEAIGFCMNREPLLVNRE